MLADLLVDSLAQCVIDNKQFLSLLKPCEWIFQPKTIDKS